MNLLSTPLKFFKEFLIIFEDMPIVVATAAGITHDFNFLHEGDPIQSVIDSKDPNLVLVDQLI